MSWIGATGLPDRESIGTGTLNARQGQLQEMVEIESMLCRTQRPASD
ncbi:hypothetical protein PAMC26577_19380 [Caballeronia sordidicola]|uniref:Uncharacterized protein n=1 Tax=Caballeronia sordidicola TaxID=196367 RepID=A0A242MNV1_CABSO|nr:hypothetical protein PAMC26577_19380 [Caballeronia sordidicola]